MILTFADLAVYCVHLSIKTVWSLVSPSIFITVSQDQDWPPHFTLFLSPYNVPGKKIILHLYYALQFPRHFLIHYYIWDSQKSLLSDQQKPFRHKAFIYIFILRERKGKWFISRHSSFLSILTLKDVDKIIFKHKLKKDCCQDILQNKIFSPPNYVNNKND